MNKNKRKPFSFLNLVIVLLSFVLAISIITTIFVFRENRTVYYDSESTLYMYLSDEEYSTLANRYYDNVIGHEEDSQVRKLADFYAVGRYFESAFLANAYQKAGNSEKEEKMRQKMESFGEEMGQFAGEKDRILSLFPDL